MLNCLVRWSDRVKRFEKKFAECGNIFLQNFSFNSIAYTYLIVKFLFCLFFVEGRGRVNTRQAFNLSMSLSP